MGWLVFYKNPALSGDPDSRSGMHLARICVLLALFAVFCTGCTLIKLKKEVRRSLASTVLVGRIAAEPMEEGRIVVVAYAGGKGARKVAHFSVLHEAGEYELLVPEGTYYVCAFWDRNRNLVFDKGEPGGQYGAPDPVSAPSGGVVLDINFSIPDGPSEIDLPKGFVVSRAGPDALKSRQAGAVVSLDDDRFAVENGSKGFWEPFAFFRQFGGNIYFLEPYDPEKIPILFIHGAAGTPRGWEYFINHIDRERFQPWLFYYPTGVRLKAMSYLLFWKLYNLHIKYQFNTLYVTAHSMGGLVARSLIMDYGRHLPFIKLFIALATPWGGDRMAEYGVRQSPAVIPSWIDMQPDGEFIQSLYREKLPESVAFYMFTGHRGSRNPFRSNNDGTITLDSLLDLRPQAEARMNYAFNEDHASIVSSPAVLAQYNAIIDTFAEDARTTRVAGGYLRIDFTYDYLLENSKPRPILILQPKRPGAAATEIPLGPGDSGRRIGPFPTGDYAASLMAPAVRPDRHHVPVTILGDETRDLKFSFSPDGMIYGHVAAASDAEDRSAGMPAELYLPGEPELRIQSVTLKGAGVERTVRHQKTANANDYDSFLSSSDFCSKNYFHFFGLPTGEYEVRITAKGFRPSIKTYTVKPGRPADFRVTEMIPDR